MFLHSNAELPRRIREQLTEDAQSIFREAFNSMIARECSEESATCIAWATVKRTCFKGADGRWRLKVSAAMSGAGGARCA